MPSFEDSFGRERGGISDVDALRDFAERCTPHSEVSAPVYERILELNPRDLKAIAAFGFAQCRDGDDGLA
jgi:hypothetical protein